MELKDIPNSCPLIDGILDYVKYAEEDTHQGEKESVFSNLYFIKSDIESVRTINSNLRDVAGGLQSRVEELEEQIEEIRNIIN